MAENVRKLENINNLILKCPKCGADMVLRAATKGQYSGKQFFGCSEYPECKSIVNIEPVSKPSLVTEHLDIQNDINEKQKPKTYVIRRNKKTNDIFIELDDEFLVSPEGKVIKGDTERFGDREEVVITDLGEKQFQVYKEKIKIILQKKLFNELKKLRRKLAAEKNIPLYEVYLNKTLIEISQIMPETEEAMLLIEGVNAYDYQTYGHHFVEFVKKFKKEYE